MRMVHYYLGMALVLAPCLALTVITGALEQHHLALGLFTAVLCVATNTLLILFMIVTGRVLKIAMQSRDLGPEFLGELNQFFARRRAYPMSVLAAFAATAAAVLGHGRFIGVPALVHVLCGLAAVIVNALALSTGVRTLRANQLLLDRAAVELDRLDAEGATVRDTGGPQWSYPRSTRWLVFALSAWGPYLYWSLVVWRGAFDHVSPVFLVLSGLASAFGLAQALRARAAAH